MKARKLLYKGLRWFYWNTRAPAEDPLLEKLLFDAFLRGCGSVDLHVQAPPGAHRRENMS
jgi:hypothetical protein